MQLYLINIQLISNDFDVKHTQHHWLSFVIVIILFLFFEGDLEDQFK